MARTQRILVYNRAAGRIEPEVVLGESFVRALYGNRLGRAAASALFSRRFFSRLFGKVQDLRFSARKIRRVARDLGIDLAEIEKPAEEYRTFNEFFTRALKEGARPIDRRPDAAISPCDGRLLAFSSLDPGRSLTIKGSLLDLASLVGDARVAGRFAGGAVLVYRLCPADYHRFHFPESCTPGPAASLGGPLHSVNPIALGTGLRILDANRRMRTMLEAGGRAGAICMVEVGAMCVGSIVQSYEPGRPAVRGEEKGMFRFGGSTVVVLYEPGRIAVDADIAARSAEGLETLVRVGSAVGSYEGTA